MLDAIDFGLLIWLIIGSMAGVAEMLTGTLFLLPFTIGAIVAAVLTAVGVDMVWAMVVFAVISIASLILLRRFAAHDDATGPRVNAGGGRYLDAIGVVTTDIAGESFGRVRIETESWRSLSHSGQPIAAGTKVRVVEVRGNALVVESL